MATSRKKKSFSTPSGSQMSADLTLSEKGTSLPPQPSGQQTKTPTTAVQRLPQTTLLHQKVNYSIPLGQFASSQGQIPPEQQAMLPGQQMVYGTSSGRETSKSTPSSKGTSWSVPSGKGIYQQTPQSQQSPTPEALLQQAPQPNLLGQQSSPPILPGQGSYSGQQMHYPTPPGLQPTYTTQPGQQLQLQKPPGSSTPPPPKSPPPTSPGVHLPEQKQIVKIERQQASVIYYQLGVIALAAILSINGIAWLIVYIIRAANSEDGLRKPRIGIAVAFASSTLTNFCGLLCACYGPSCLACYMAILYVDCLWMIAVISLAAVHRFVITAVVAAMVIVISTAQFCLSAWWDGTNDDLLAERKRVESTINTSKAPLIK